MKSENEYVSLCYRGVKISNVNYQDIYQVIASVAKSGSRHYICLTDVGNVIRASKNEYLKRAINGSALSLADGTPLRWFARLVGCQRMERISGVELMERLFRGKDGMKHFLLGDTEDAIERVIAKARSINGNVQISGYSPPFKEFDTEDNRAMMERIRAAAPDIIWVSFGGGKQEVWMQQNIRHLKSGVMIGVGAAFKWFTGTLKVPPKIFQQLGLQCLFRVVQELVFNPVKGWTFFVERQVKVFPVFLINLPFEVWKQRRSLSKSIDTSIR